MSGAIAEKAINRPKGSIFEGLHETGRQAARTPIGGFYATPISLCRLGGDHGGRPNGGIPDIDKRGEVCVNRKILEKMTMGNVSVKDVDRTCQGGGGSQTREKKDPGVKERGTHNPPRSISVRGDKKRCSTMVIGGKKKGGLYRMRKKNSKDVKEKGF